MRENKVQNYDNVTRWLIICMAAVFLMVILGGLTRLTDSGLSIVKWEPLSGAIPPLSEEAWLEYFNAYKQIPEYQQQNNGMTLEEFKGIFWLEYFHRLMGRLTGFIFLLPLIYFAARRKITRPTAVKFGGIFALGAVQGAIGWYMVSSGLAERTDVSQYRLALHLGAAFLIFALIEWAYLDLKNPKPFRANGLAEYSAVVTILVFFMIILGAFVAGTDAGFTYNTFPLMDGKWVPDNLYMMNPAWLNHFENLTMIQFQHRVFAVVIALSVIFLAIKILNKNPVCSIALLAVVALQIGLGIATLYSFGSYADYEPVSHAYQKVLYAPVIIAATHQLNALVLFALTIKATHSLFKD